MLLQEAERYFEDLLDMAGDSPDMAPNTVTYAALISGETRGGGGSCCCSSVGRRDAAVLWAVEQGLRGGWRVVLPTIAAPACARERPAARALLNPMSHHAPRLQHTRRVGS